MRLKYVYCFGVRIPNSRITPIGTERKGKTLKYVLRCDCGNPLSATPTDIGHGKVKSCGCYKSDMASARKTHGLSKRPEYFASFNAFSRCRNKKSKYYKWYGKRGIKVNFRTVEQMTKWLIKNLPKPNGKFCLDRIDNDGHYQIGNLKWSTHHESALNKRGTRKITINGAEKHLCEWEKESGVCAMTIHCRIKSGLPERLWLFRGKITSEMILNI